MDLPIKNCRKCYLLNPQNNSFQCQGNVEYIFGEEIYISFENFNLNKAQLYDQSILFYDAVNGLVTCTCDLLDFKPCEKKENRVKALCLIKEVQNAVNRHEDFRLSLSLAISLDFIRPGAKKMEMISAMTTNISAGGLYFITAEQLPVPVFQLRFSHNILPFIFQARILREEQLEYNQFGYGCRFENLSSNAESALRGYIFQMETLHKR